MKRAYAFGVVVLAVLLAAQFCAAQADTTQGRGGAKKAGGNLDAKDMNFLKEAASGGLLEVRLGTLVQQSATDDSVKAFAARMVRDHSKVNDELTTLAGSKGVTLPTTLNKAHQSAYDSISKKTGAALDKAYMAQMVKDHIKDVAEFRKMAKNAADPDVRAFASKTLPVLEQHLAMAKSIDAKFKGKAAKTEGETGKSERKSKSPSGT